MTRSTIFAIAAAALSTATIASPAVHAAEAAPQANVSWRDLDLRTDAGQRSLARRTERAASAVCPDGQVTGSHLRNTEVDACRASVRAQVAQRVAAGTRVALGK